MATNNFYKKNASFFYVLNEDDEDRSIWDLVEKDILYALSRIGFEDIRQENRYDKDGKIIAVKELYEENIAARLYVIERAGYYFGANLDWDFSILDDYCNEIKCGDYYESDFYDYLKDKKEIKEMKKQQKRIIKKLDKEIDRLEATLEKITTHYIKVGQFSNGEAVYEKAK